MLRDQDFNDDRKDAGEIGAGHSVTAIYEIVPAGVEVDRPRVDPLKYSPAPPAPASASAREPSGELRRDLAGAASGRGGGRAAAAKYDAELMTVKLRYKAPDGDESRLTSAVIVNRPAPMTTNLGFASAVAEAGMLLRGSGHVTGGSYASAIARARKFRGEDADGYRAEFMRLMELAVSLSKTRAGR
jgi:Ca-activated chloride channel family protein